MVARILGTCGYSPLLRQMHAGYRGCVRHLCCVLRPNIGSTETVIIIPPHGIQLETHRGLPYWPRFVSRRFIPLTNLQDVIINEALRGWNVRYYLAVVKGRPSVGFSLEVAFEVGFLAWLRTWPTRADYKGSRIYFLECPYF